MAEPKDHPPEALVQYVVSFVAPGGERAWWGVYFIELEEAARWAEWELERIARGELGWVGEILRGRWHGAEFMEEPEPVKIVPMPDAPRSHEAD